MLPEKQRSIESGYKVVLQSRKGEIHPVCIYKGSIAESIHSSPELVEEDDGQEDKLDVGNPPTVRRLGEQPSLSLAAVPLVIE